MQIQYTEYPKEGLPEEAKASEEEENLPFQEGLEKGLTGQPPVGHALHNFATHPKFKYTEIPDMIPTNRV